MSMVGQVLAQVRQVVDEALDALRSHEKKQDARLKELEDRVTALESGATPQPEPETAAPQVKRGPGRPRKVQAQAQAAEATGEGGDV